MYWEEYKNEFLAERSLRNIVITNVTLGDWQAFIDYLRKTRAVMQYFVDGKVKELPDKVGKVVLGRMHTYLLRIQLNEIAVTCDFLLPGEIKLVLDPREVRNELEAKIIFRLMSTAGRILNKPVVITSGNSEAQSLFIYKPGRGVKYLAHNR